MVAALFTAGQQLTADDLNEPVPIIRIKAADETVTSSATPQNDDHLICPVEANSTYLLLAYLSWSCTSATPDFRLDFDVPAGAAIPLRSFLAQPTGNTTSTGTIDTGANSSAGGDDTRMTFNGTSAGIIFGTVVVGATAGNVTLRWSQATSDAAGVTLKQYSWLRLEKVFA